MAKWNTFFLLLIVINTCVSKNLNDNLPCDFLNSTNITDGHPQPDGSILFENVTYTKYVSVLHTFENGNILHQTNPYKRGCIPENNTKPFIRLYCPFDVGMSRQDCPSYQIAQNLQHRVKFGENNYSLVTLNHYFGYLLDQPCFHDPQLDMDNYTLLHSGDVSFYEEDEEWEFNHSQYALEFRKNNETNKIEQIAKFCKVDPQDDVPPMQAQRAQFFFDSESTMTIANVFISAILFTTTFMLYLYLPDLDHFYGKMLMCYLSGPAIGYMLIVVVAFASIQPNKIYDPIGYIVYFSLISSFAWINVISFDLWKSFRTCGVLITYSEQKLLFLYMLYAWGLGLFVTFFFHITNLSQLTALDSKEQNINVPSCFLAAQPDKSCLTYFIPIWVIFAISSLFFTVTALKVYNLCQTKMERNCLKLHRLKSHINDGDNFSLHLRLHLVICTAWILRVLTLYNWMGGLKFYANISYALQGLVIFVIFVLNRHVIHFMQKWWKSYNVKKEVVRAQRTLSVRSQTSYEVLKSNEEEVQPRQRSNSIRSEQNPYDNLKNPKECPWIFESPDSMKL